MNNDQLLKNLVEWFETMCNLDMQSDADTILMDDDPAEWGKYRVLTDGIKSEIANRKKKAPPFSPVEDTAIRQYGALWTVCNCLKGLDGWTEDDGFTKESLVKMLEDEMNSFEL